jgi:hypothetical protein
MARYLFLLFALTMSVAQTDKSNKPPEPIKLSVYGDTWTDGEIKECQTFSFRPHLLICDYSDIHWTDSPLNLLGRYVEQGASSAEAWRQVFQYMSTHSKAFMVKFQKDPWANADSTKRTMLLFSDCSKNKVIECGTPIGPTDSVAPE